MKNTQFKVDDIFSDTLGKESIGNVQKTRVKTLLAKMMWLSILKNR